MQPGVFSGLDLEQPHDRELMANLPRHIRETRRALSNIKVLRVDLEAGTERGDLVFPDESGVWLRSHGGLPERRKFFGVAFPEDGAVLVGATALCPDWGWKPGKYLFLHPTQYGKLTHTEPEDAIIAGYAITGQLVVLNIFEASWYQFVADFKNWVTQEAIEIQELKEYLTAMADKVMSIEGLIGEVWESLQETETNLLPRIEALRGIFGAANMFTVEITSAVAAQGIVNIPSYHYEHASLFLLFNGVASAEWEKVPPFIGEFSTRVRMLSAIPANTQIIGIIFTEAYNTVVPEIVITDDTLTGGGILTSPLGVAPSIAQGMITVQTEVTNIKDTLAIERTFLSDLSVVVGSTSGQLSLSQLSSLGNTSAVTRVFPVANATNAGLMPATMYTKIFELSDHIDSMLGTAVRIIDDTLLATATPAQLYASWAASGVAFVDGATIENLLLGLRWTYRNGVWFGPYETLGVSMATTDTAGLVKSSAITDANTGKVYVEIDGTMSVIGYDNIRETVSNNYETIQAIANRAAKIWTRAVDINLPYEAGTTFTVPNYEVGRNQLTVYVNGIRTDMFTEHTGITVSLSSGILGTGTAQVIIDCYRSGLDEAAAVDLRSRMNVLESWRVTVDSWKALQDDFKRLQEAWNTSQQEWNNAHTAEQSIVISEIMEKITALEAVHVPSAEEMAALWVVTNRTETTANANSRDIADLIARVSALEGA